MHAGARGSHAGPDKRRPSRAGVDPKVDDSAVGYGPQPCFVFWFRLERVGAPIRRLNVSPAFVANAPTLGTLPDVLDAGESMAERGSKSRSSDRPLVARSLSRDNDGAANGNVQERLLPLYAVNHSARVSMKSAASCVN